MLSLIVVVNTFIVFLNLTKQGVTATPLQLLGDPLPLNPQPSDPLATNPFIPLSMCDTFQIQNSAFNAICPFGTVDPVDLNQCITNVDGNMVYNPEGGAFDTCNSCVISQSELTCACKMNLTVDGFAPSRETTINLEAPVNTKTDTAGQGVFATLSGVLRCNPGEIAQ